MGKASYKIFNEKIVTNRVKATGENKKGAYVTVPVEWIGKKVTVVRG